MIPEKDFMRYEKQTSKLYEELELQLIQDIAERIANVGELNTVGYNNAEILQEMGYLYDDIINDVAKFNNMNSTEVKAIFEKAGIKSIKKDDIIYKQAGISPGKISDTLVNIMERQADTTNYNILRLTRTTAMTGQNQFINAINQAYLETSSGMKSYSQSIIDAVNQVSKTGAIVQYPTGTIRSLESAVRMNVLTSIGQMSGELQLERAKEVGWDLVEVSAHIGARPEHAEWQGKVYSLTGSNGYKDFYQETGYGDMLGLCGINCRHTFYPFYKGSTTTYTKSELEEMKNAKVYYNGKEMSYYDATQLQRRMERTIRQNRKNIAGLNGLQNSDVDNQDLKIELQKAKDKLTRNQNTLSDFIQQTGFKDNDRTYIGSGKLVNEKINKKSVINIENIHKNTSKKIAEKIPTNIIDFQEYYTNNSDEIVTPVNINKLLKYDELPTLVSKDEFEVLAKNNKYGILERGFVTDSQTGSIKDISDNYKRGNFYVGEGVYGSGTYTAYGKNAHSMARSYASSDNNVLQFLLKDDAKVADFWELEKQHDTELNEMIKEKGFKDYFDVVRAFQSPETTDEIKRTAMYIMKMQDMGVYASVKGYDAINVVAETQYSETLEYIVILNRKKMIMYD